MSSLLPHFSKQVPKGSAWLGENLNKIFQALDLVLEELFNIHLTDLKNELSLDTMSNDMLTILFREVNSRNLFPQALSFSDYRLIVKLFKLSRAWITRTDIVDMMGLIDYQIEFLDSVDVFNNPGNYPQIKYIPQSLYEAWFIIYYKLIPIVETPSQLFPLPFPLLFEGEKRSIAGRLMEEITDAHIALYQYE